MHARAGAIDQIETTVLVRIDIVRLDGLLPVGQCRNVTADLFRPQHVAHIDRAKPGIEIGEEDGIGPRTSDGMFSRMLCAPKRPPR